MLTRIEIDGFKTFEEFKMDLNPFQVILGPNSSGKSNFFDALHFLSRLAETDVKSAFRQIRGQPHELFRRQPDGLPGKRMLFAAEVLLDPHLGESDELKHPRLRYEVTVERQTHKGRLEQFVVSHEEITRIPATRDTWQPGGTFPSRTFQDKVMLRGANLRQQRPILTTSGKHHSLYSDSTMLATLGLYYESHFVALRNELLSWRILQLNPSSLHKHSLISDPDQLEPSGGNLAKVLARIERETATKERPTGDLADLAADLANIVPGVLNLRVSEDDESNYRLDLQMKDQQWYNSRVVSDGTLRILALIAVLYDPKHRGLVCFEEPENGIHPARLKAVIRRLRELVTDPHSEKVDDAPLSQMILSSHSPVVLSCLDDENIVFFDLTTVVDPKTKRVRQQTRNRILQPANGELPSNNGHIFLSRAEVKRYLLTAETEG
jgi:predicted ATPase